MIPRAFTSRIEMCHKRWLAKVLDMDYSVNGGIDLLDDEKGIELKCRYKRWYPHFAVHEYEINKFEEENHDKKLFWGFLVYNLATEPKKIGKKNIDNIVSERNIWFMDWDYVRQFPSYHPKTGPYVYVTKNKFPPDETFQRFERKGGNLYVPKGSLLEKELSVQ
jgi:hypothetical protein